MPKQPYSLEFQPKERRRRDQVLRFLGGFCAIVLLLGIVSTVVVLRSDLVEQLRGALFPTQPATEPPPDAWLHSGSALFLLCETDDARQDIRFCALVRADVERRQLHVFPLSPGAMTPFEAGERSLEQALRSGGPKELKTAIEALIEEAGGIDRYICCTDDGFVKIVNLLGSVTVQVAERVRYSGSSFTLTLAEGSQRLQGDMLLRYFRYLGTLKPPPAEPSGLPVNPENYAALRQGALLARVLETYIALEADAPRLEALFNSLMNILDTDVTVNDFYTRREMLLDILANGDSFVVDVRE